MQWTSRYASYTESLRNFKINFAPGHSQSGLLQFQTEEPRTVRYVYLSIISHRIFFPQFHFVPRRRLHSEPTGRPAARIGTKLHPDYTHMCIFTKFFHFFLFPGRRLFFPGCFIRISFVPEYKVYELFNTGITTTYLSSTLLDELPPCRTIRFSTR